MNSEKRESGCWDLMVKMFNDAKVLLQPSIVKDLHDNYQQPIECSKGADELTVGRCKDLMQDMKARLRELMKRYNIIGNSSDMVVFDHDSDGECEVEENECTCRRYNGERALKRSKTKGDDAMILRE